MWGSAVLLENDVSICGKAQFLHLPQKSPSHVLSNTWTNCSQQFDSYAHLQPLTYERLLVSQLFSAAHHEWQAEMYPILYLHVYAPS
jgi:hypothetical protein